jgi:osmotically-inducible protein OsmY
LVTVFLTAQCSQSENAKGKVESMEGSKTSRNPIHRADTEIREDIWQALWQEEPIRSIDIYDISVAVEGGQVCLSGHVSKDLHNQRIEAITWSIPGVVAVHNHLVSDTDLSLQVAQALVNDERTRPFVLPVFCDHGWVKLGGSVPNREIQHIAEARAASVPTVRGVILLPEITGEQDDPPREAVQPGIGVRVFGEDETQGTVYQVVIDPQNRLVTHAIVRDIQTSNGRQAWCDYRIPVEAMRMVDTGGIFLSHEANVLSQFPIFNPAHYPFALLTWQPPYPYAVGSVRWPRQGMAKTERRLTPNDGKAELN